MYIFAGAERRNGEVMNIFTQIAIGILPVFILFLVFAIVRKPHRIRNIAVSIIFGILIVSDITAYFVYASTANVMSADDISTNVGLIYAVAAEENGLSEASELLREFREISLDDAEVTLCDAYLRAAAGDAKGAKVLYEKAVTLEKKFKDEKLLKLCEEAIKESKIDFAAEGADYDKADEKLEDLKEYALDKISDLAAEYGDMSDMAEVLIEAETIFDSYMNGTPPSEEEVKKLIKRIESIAEDEPALLSMTQTRMCRLKLLVLIGDYDEIAYTIDENSGFEELAVVSELYINNMINEGSFNEKYGEDYEKVYEKVSKQLEKVSDNIPDSNPTDKKGAKALCEQLENASSSPALYRVKDSISQYAEDETNPDRPKAYMQLAKIEYQTGTSEVAEKHISSSLGTVGMSDDDSFTVPMTKIVDVITDKEDPEKLKQVAQYVNDVTNHTADEVVIKVVNSAKNEDSSESSSGEEEKEEKETFNSFVTDYVSRKRITIDITRVDSSDFETVKAVVNVDDSMSITAEELKNLISVKDCRADITEFTVEKVEYEAANILLCCDVSGSMGGKPIEDLKNAVVSFVDTSSDIENLALVPFSGDVLNVYDFGTSNSKIREAAEGFASGGGTNMYGAIISSLDLFEYEEGELNSILLLSDGADGGSHSTEDIYENIGLPGKDKGVILYSLGLGEVNADYMNTLAASTGGSFVYVSDSSTLDSFYEHLRNQILNQYIITFKAEDTLSVDRELKIYATEDPVSQDIEYYSLNSDEVSDETNTNLITLQNKGIYGLDTRLIYRSSKPTEVTLKVSDFEKNDKISIELDGDLDYGDGSVVCKFVDKDNISVTLPGGIACGVYDLRISVNGKNVILDDELTVVTQGSENTTEFGPYVFTSYTKAESGNQITLSNYVVMNGWLHFTGDVVLSGDLGAYQINMTDNSGSYVKYYTETAAGLAKYLANKNKVLSLPPMGTMTLYNNPSVDAESDEYPVKTAVLPILSMPDVFTLNSAGVDLYPNRISVQSNAFTTKLPMQDKLLKSTGINSLFDFKAEAGGTITNKSIGVNVKVSTKGEEGVYSPVNFGAMPIYVSPADVEVDINTLKHEYSIDFGTKLAFLDSDGLGLKLEWKARSGDKGLEFAVPSAVELRADARLKGTIGPVPVTYKDFKLGLDDIDPNSNILNWKLTGGCDIATAKLSELVPGISEVIGDPSVLTLDNVKGELSLGQRYIALSADLKLLEEVSLARAKIEAGKISFTSVMLGMNNEEAAGFLANLGVGIKWDTDNCKINVGADGTFSAHTKFCGVEAAGTCDVNVKWWILEKSVFAEGRGVIGMYVDEYGRLNFIIKARETAANGSKEYYLCWNKDVGMDYGTKKL